jgi:hypothetical protein
MEKSSKLLLSLILLCFSVSTYAQNTSPNKVKYMITYDESESLFTAWVVPSYSTPNFNNLDSEEKGATAQFSVKVPKGFVIHSFKSLKGDWSGYNSKISIESSLQEAGLSTDYEYYILSKAPTETNYGSFESGNPVALFSFSGSTSNPQKVAVINNDDLFIEIYYNKLSLNVAASFYSKSGQNSKANAIPLEQFLEKIELTAILKEAAEKVGATESLLLDPANPSDILLVYSNPSDSVVNLKYFSLREGANAKIELVDQNGSVLQEKSGTTHSGFNTTTIDVSSYSGLIYFAKVSIGNKVLYNKIIKTN